MKTSCNNVSSEGQSSAQIVASIDDLLTQILLRLPIKSLIRFKSVSKHWSSVINDPRFCFMRHRNPNPPVGLLLSYHGDFMLNPSYVYVPLSGIKSTNPPFAKSRFIRDPNRMFVIQSCNGLLLSYTCRPRALGGHDYRYYVYNPTTNQISTLPKPYQGCYFKEMILAFDPAKSPHYKVVCAEKLGTHHGSSIKHEYRFVVYSSESRVWRKRGKPFVLEFEFENGVYWNGGIHWIDIYFYVNRCYYFNIEDQILRVKKMPSSSDVFGIRWDTRLRESCGHLHYVIEKKSPTRLWIVYELRRDYSEWFVKYQFDISGVVPAYPVNIEIEIDDNPFYINYLFSLIRGDRDEDSFLVLHIRGKLIRYNIVYHTFETIYLSAEVGGSRRPLDLEFQYVESLCCV